MRNHDFEAFFVKNPIFGGKMGVAATVAPKGLGPQVSTKKLAHWVDLLSHPLSRKLVFKKIGSEPPPLLNSNKVESSRKYHYEGFLAKKCCL